jgi:photosystem II stability/assembly factor-like uncharacterized protein
MVLLAVLAAALLLASGAAASLPTSLSTLDSRSLRGATAMERVVPRTLNPFTAMDCVSASKAWAVSLEANVRTLDGGATWQSFSLPGTLRYDPQGVDFVNANVGYIVGIDIGAAGGNKAVVLKTKNGGTTWTVKKRFAGFDLLAGVCFVSTQKGWVAGRGGRIFKTTDGGASWKAQSSKTSKTLYAVKFVDATHGWAVGATGTVTKTADGGRSWASKSITTTDLLTVDFASVARGWTGGSIRFETGRILSTVNGGKAWKYQSGPAGTMFQPIASVDFLNKSIGLAGGVHTLIYTTDGGSHWLGGSPEPSGSVIVGVKLANAKVGFAACTNYTILKTVDGGATWTTVLAPSVR